MQTNQESLVDEWRYNRIPYLYKMDFSETGEVFTLW